VRKCKETTGKRITKHFMHTPVSDASSDHHRPRVKCEMTFAHCGLVAHIRLLLEDEMNDQHFLPQIAMYAMRCFERNAERARGETTYTLQSGIDKHSLPNSPVISGNKASLKSMRRLQLSFSGAWPLGKIAARKHPDVLYGGVGTTLFFPSRLRNIWLERLD
jgi:hypothetical protein